MYVYLPTDIHSPLAVVTHSQLQLLFLIIDRPLFYPIARSRTHTKHTTHHITHHTLQNGKLLLLLLQNTRPRDPHSHQRSPRRRECVLRKPRWIVAEQRTCRRSDACLRSRLQGRHDTRQRLFRAVCWQREGQLVGADGSFVRGDVSRRQLVRAGLPRWGRGRWLRCGSTLSKSVCPKSVSVYPKSCFAARSQNRTLWELTNAEKRKREKWFGVSRTSSQLAKTAERYAVWRRTVTNVPSRPGPTNRILKLLLGTPARSVRREISGDGRKRRIVRKRFGA